MDPVLRFGSFELDPDSGELLEDGAPVRLQPQPFKVLYLLARRSGETVTRDEVRRAVWGEDTHVDFDQGLGYCLSQIRTALGDCAHEPRYVQTLPRRGYRFLAEVVPVAAQPAAAPAWRRPLARAATAAALVAFGVALALRGPTPGGADPPSHVRLAVLPFEDLSGPGSDVPLGDALSEEILSELGRLNPSRLSVIARSSALPFRGPGTDLARLRDELDVDYALEGSVRVEGERVRITTRLIRLSDVSQVRVEVYDRRLGDLLALQRRVASDTARSVRVALTPDARRRLATARPVDAEVSHLTLVAAHHMRQRTPASLRRARSLFRQAIERDAEHAPAWAGLAETLIALVDRGLLPATGTFDSAEQAARRAVTLDPHLASAHATLGGIAVLRDWAWETGREHYERSLALEPDATVHRWYSQLLLILGDREGALEQARRAVALDPLSVPANEQLQHALALAGDHAAALEQARRTERIDPDSVDLRKMRAWTLLGQGRPEEALAALGALPHAADADDCGTLRARALMAVGRESEARAALEEQLPPPGDLGRACLRGQVLAMLGRHDEALDALEAAVSAKAPCARWIALLDELELLEGSSRYQALRRELGLGARERPAASARAGGRWSARRAP